MTQAKTNRAGNSRVAGPALRVLLAAMLCAGLAACDNHEGPMEKAGKKVDQTATDVGNKIEDKCEQAKEAMNAKDTDC